MTALAAGQRRGPDTAQEGAGKLGREGEGGTSKEAELMISVIRNGSILALLLAIGGASALADQVGRAELLLCTKQTSECVAVGMIYNGTSCKAIVENIEGRKHDWEMWEKLEQLRRLEFEKCCPTPAPSATPTDADRKMYEGAQKAVEQAKELASQFYYMCRPM